MGYIACVKLNEDVLEAHHGWKLNALEILWFSRFESTWDDLV